MGSVMFVVGVICVFLKVMLLSVVMVCRCNFCLVSFLGIFVKVVSFCVFVVLVVFYLGFGLVGLKGFLGCVVWRKMVVFVSGLLLCVILILIG